MARDAVAEARDIVSHARSCADVILGDAARRSDDVAARARAEADAVVQAERAAARVASAAEIGVAAGEIRALALDVARAIVGEQAATATDVLESAVRRALEPLRRARALVVRAHPDDVQTLRARCDRWVGDGWAAELLDVVADPDVSRGGVIVESDVGRADARVETRIALLAKALDGG